jgi:hypothetical protein
MNFVADEDVGPLHLRVCGAVLSIAVKQRKLEVGKGDC